MPVVIERSRNTGVDVGRALACLFVVSCHANMAISANFIWFFQYGPLALMYFMVICGFVLAFPFCQPKPKETFDLALYFKKRAIRIVPAYYVAISLVVAVKAIGIACERSHSASELLWQAGSHLLFIHEWFGNTAYALNPAWHSMTLEAQYYALFPFLLFAFIRIGSPLVFLATVTFISLAYAALLARFGPTTNTLIAGLCFNRIFEFAAGMTVAGIFAARGESMRPKLLGIALVSMTTGGFLLHMESDLGGLLGMQALVLSAFIAFLFLGTRKATIPGISSIIGVGAYLGRISYSTFLVHASVGNAAMKLLLPFVKSSWGIWGVAGSFAAYIVLAHAAGVVFFTLVERPGSKLLSRWLG
ncbi:MAG: acyltransferase [Deltaproteobacteria bacterium]|nr:acyltransferase [Deltaproteobacteria bacterium]